MRIIFIRHGRTQSNVERLLDTAFPGTPLDEVGEAQAAGLAARLAHEPIEAVMTSDITRARQTGEPLAAALGVPLIVHPGVREVFAGDWEMSTDWTEYEAVVFSWENDLDASMPNGDSGISFFERFDQAICELFDYDCVAVVSHGAALYAWLGGRGDLTFPEGEVWRLSNTDFVIVEGNQGAWRILSWGDRDLT